MQTVRMLLVGYHDEDCARTFPAWADGRLDAQAKGAIHTASQLAIQRFPDSKHFFYWPLLDRSDSTYTVNGSSAALSAYLGSVSLLESILPPNILITGNVAADATLCEAGYLVEKLKVAEEKRYSALMYPALSAVDPLADRDATRINRIPVRTLREAEIIWFHHSTGCAQEIVDFERLFEDPPRLLEAIPDQEGALLTIVEAERERITTVLAPLLSSGTKRALDALEIFIRKIEVHLNAPNWNRRNAEISLLLFDLALVETLLQHDAELAFRISLLHVKLANHSRETENQQKWYDLASRSYCQIRTHDAEDNKRKFRGNKFVGDILADNVYRFISNKGRVLGTSFLLSAFLATIIFIKINYEPYYLTKGIEYEIEAKTLCKILRDISNPLTPANSQSKAIMNAINRIISHSSSYVVISVGNQFEFDNGKKDSLDISRSTVTYQDSFTSSIGFLNIRTWKSNKPKLRDHLIRAWTWSAIDFMKDYKGWLSHNLYQRSEFLYKGLAIIWVSMIFMFSLLKSKHEESHFLKSQLEKEGYCLRYEYDTLNKEVEEMLAGGGNCDSDIIIGMRQKLEDLKVALIDLNVKTNKNILDAKIEYFEPNHAYTIDEIRQKLCISTITNNSDISVISYFDRCFQQKSHVRFFIELLDLNIVNANHLNTINVSVPISRGQDREKMEQEIRNRFERYLSATLFDKLKIDVHYISDKGYLHMRAMDIIGGSAKLTLKLEKGMDFLEPNMSDKSKYSSPTRTYVVVVYSC